MAKIKSALEIALEKTESVKSDKTVIGQYNAKQKGKKLANQFLEGNIKSLEDEIKAEDKEAQASLKQGLFDVFISQIILPAAKEEIDRIEISCKGIYLITGSKRFSEMSKQFIQVLNQFLSETVQYEEAIKRQYAPKLRQKEEELSRRLGRNVKLDPFQDPEFIPFFNQNMNALKEKYQAAVDQVKEEASNLFKNG
jgi:dGTP triphosphohydrolase